MIRSCSSGAVTSARSPRSPLELAAHARARARSPHVEELLAANVGAEAGLGHDEALLADELERHLVGDDGAVAVCDVGEGPGVHEDGRALDRLHERGHDRVLHEHGQRAADAEVVRRDGLARGAARTDDEAAEALAHVGEARAEREHGHDLAGHGDVEARLARVAVLGGALPDGHAPQVAVARVEHALPRDAGRVDVEQREAHALLGRQQLRVGQLGRVLDAELAQAPQHDGREAARARLHVARAEPVEDLEREALAAAVVGARLVEHARVDGRGQQVVGRGDGVDVACQVQVELLHGDDLRVAAARRAALDAEGRALAWLADARDDAAAQVRAQRLAHADGRRRLALAQRRRVDARHDDVVAVARAAQALEHAQVHLGLDGAVEVELALQQARVRRDARDGQRRQRLRDVDVGRHGGEQAHARGGLRD